MELVVTKTQDDLTDFFIKTIFDVADNSVAIRLKVGCIFVNNNNIVGIGYNHTPFDRNQSCQVQVDGELVSKPWINFDENKDGVIHAEIDCMRRMKNSNVPTQGCVVYVTDACCLSCAKELVKAKVSEVYYVRPYRIMDGVNYLLSNGIKVEKISKK